jgi:hypothetical protein
MSSWALVISVRIVYDHQLSMILMRVWSRIVRPYLKLCILALRMLLFNGIFNSIIDIISAITHIVGDGKIHRLMCVDTYSLNYIHVPL